MKHIENIVIGNPLCSHIHLLSSDINDWANNEKDKTYFTNERNLAKILVELDIYPSFSEIRRNKPELVITLDKPDFIKIKPKKKVPLWIVVGGEFISTQYEKENDKNK